MSLENYNELLDSYIETKSKETYKYKEWEWFTHPEWENVNVLQSKDNDMSYEFMLYDNGRDFFYPRIYKKTGIIIWKDASDHEFRIFNINTGGFELLHDIMKDTLQEVVIIDENGYVVSTEEDGEPLGGIRIEHPELGNLELEDGYCGVGDCTFCHDSFPVYFRKFNKGYSTNNYTNPEDVVLRVIYTCGNKINIEYESESLTN